MRRGEATHACFAVATDTAPPHGLVRAAVADKTTETAPHCPHTARVHVAVDVLEAPELPMAAIAGAGRGSDWLAEESDLYADADLVERAG
jgi:hypothetical protein